MITAAMSELPTALGDAITLPGRGLRRVEGGVLRFSMAHFLGALVLMLIMTPFVDTLPSGDMIESALLSLVLGSAVLAVGARRRTLLLAVLLAVPAIAATWGRYLMGETISPEIAIASALVFASFVAFHLLRFILLAPKVDAEVLCAGIATYLMLALLWAFAYELVDRTSPQAFTFSSSTGSPPSLRGFTAIYFSMGALSTGAFGDITPTSGLARMLATLEQSTGVFYMALLVARLVSLYPARKSHGS